MCVGVLAAAGAAGAGGTAATAASVGSAAAAGAGAAGGAAAAGMSAAGLATAAGVAGAGYGALQMLSTAGRAVGQIYSSYSQYQQAKQQQEMMKRNAALEEERAKDAMRRGKEKVARHLMSVGQMRGKQKAALAASGVETDSGSPLAILLDTDKIANIDAAIIAENAEREASGFSHSAANMRMVGDDIMASGRGRAIGSLLTTGYTVADKWYRHKKGY